MTDRTAEQIAAETPVILSGDVIRLGDRDVIVLPFARDWRGRFAVRNVATNRLSYIQEWRLLRAKETTR